MALLRHGDAERHAASDEMRRLTPRGRADAAAVGLSMQALGLVSVYASPYLRARETAEIIAENCGLGTVEILAGITPDDDPRRAIARLDGVVRAQEPCVVVTHMPLIGALVARLVDGNVGAGPGIATASGVLLTGEVFVPGLLRVERLLTP